MGILVYILNMDLSTWYIWTLENNHKKIIPKMSRKYLSVLTLYFLSSCFLQLLYDEIYECFQTTIPFFNCLYLKISLSFCTHLSELLWIDSTHFIPILTLCFSRIIRTEFALPFCFNYHSYTHLSSFGHYWIYMWVFCMIKLLYFNELRDLRNFTNKNIKLIRIELWKSNP